jgi:methanogenesis multiheme c-type cytochrome
MEGTMSCTRVCHSSGPHGGGPHGDKLDQHTGKVACETCHTGARPARALESRSWNVFSDQGAPLTTWRASGWMPEHKWYDNTGPGLAGAYDLPILGHAERRDVAGARIYPFNAVTVDWFVKQPDSAYDDVIIVPEVMAADANGDGLVTVGEMQAVYPGATLVTADMNFSISHSVRPKEEAFDCGDCHGGSGWLLDWQKLGYSRDPGGNNGGKEFRKKP